MTVTRLKRIYYIVEPVEWVTFWDGKFITENIKKLFNHPIKILKTSRIRLSRIKEHILHFSSRNTYLPSNHEYINKDNKIIMTWYHGTDRDIDYIKLLPSVSRDLSVIHTSCSITERQLIEWGAPKSKIRVIPIGIDFNMFDREKDKKSYLRKKIGIPENSVCIGSFQKDGDGWGEGNSPKLIKGPDIFCDIVERLSKEYPIFVLLSGPARGYVKKRLEKAEIPYRHIFLKNYFDITKLYKALDLYIISSRVEGGPKAILESFASGVPLVSTNVGMVNDIAKNRINAMVSDIDDTESLIKDCNEIIKNNSLRIDLVNEGLKTVKEFDWKIIAARYYREIYSKLL